VILEAVKEIRFNFYLFRDMGIPVKFPFMVRTDNIEGMFMEKKTSSSVRTRCVLILGIKLSVNILKMGLARLCLLRRTITI
jgi:hypothetical protein